jgi:hypothetical protein
MATTALAAVHAGCIVRESVEAWDLNLIDK